MLISPRSTALSVAGSGDGHPVALADGLGGAGGQEAEGHDLDPPGDAVAGAGAGAGAGAAGDFDGQAELDAGGAALGGEGAGSSPRRPVTVMEIGFMAFPPWRE
jgi:hypothetical protein